MSRRRACLQFREREGWCGEEEGEREREKDKTGTKPISNIKKLRLKRVGPQGE